MHVLFNKHFSGLREAIVDTLFPTQCLVCRRDDSVIKHGLCSSCDEAITAICQEPACPTCGRSVAKYEVSQRICGDCRGKIPRVNGTVRVGPYAHVMQPLIKAFKYQCQENVLELFGPKLANVVLKATWFSRVEAIAIVPTHWRRRLRRPFYAPSSLADYVSRACHLPLAPILRRTRCGPHQIGLSYKARVQNVRGAFALRKGVKLSKARILLIDDVKTTGATIEECARVLRGNGATEVYAAVAARAQGSPGDFMKNSAV